MIGNRANVPIINGGVKISVHFMNFSQMSMMFMSCLLAEQYILRRVVIDRDASPYVAKSGSVRGQSVRFGCPLQGEKLQRAGGSSGDPASRVWEGSGGSRQVSRRIFSISEELSGPVRCGVGERELQRGVGKWSRRTGNGSPPNRRIRNREGCGR